ncbi:hypothetical protein [Dictyobacter halimunensis]|uniref:hypothetical protein n=1 Tax=Dictyobacter halimunensis TaxID=3026934 RepID=UPI0030C67CB6
MTMTIAIMTMMTAMTMIVTTTTTTITTIITTIASSGSTFRPGSRITPLVQGFFCLIARGSLHV